MSILKIFKRGTDGAVVQEPAPIKKPRRSKQAERLTALETQMVTMTTQLGELTAAIKQQHKPAPAAEKPRMVVKVPFRSWLRSVWDSMPVVILRRTLPASLFVISVYLLILTCLDNARLQRDLAVQRTELAKYRTLRQWCLTDPAFRRHLIELDHLYADTLTAAPSIHSLESYLEAKGEAK